MAKLIVIEECGECPHFYNQSPDYLAQCMKLAKRIFLAHNATGPDYYPINEECPLADNHDQSLGKNLTNSD